MGGAAAVRGRGRKRGGSCAPGEVAVDGVRAREAPVAADRGVEVKGYPVVEREAVEAAAAAAEVAEEEGMLAAVVEGSVGCASDAPAPVILAQLASWHRSSRGLLEDALERRGRRGSAEGREGRRKGEDGETVGE